MRNIPEQFININAKTQLNMVIGYPLSHTQSPELHHKIYQALNINAILLAFSNPDLSALINAIKALSVGLTAVTMPFKEKIIPFLDDMSEEVKIMQSANTVIQRDKKLIGYNTDIAGIAHALDGVTLQQKKVLVIGAGGAARAVGYFLHSNDARIYWHNRTLSKAQNLAKLFGGEILDDEALNASKHEFNVVIQTTPIGMFPEVNASPLSDELAKRIFHSQQTVFDLIYNPRETLFLTQAKRHGAKIIFGSKMFTGQAIQMVALWTNRGDIYELYRD